MDLLYYVDTEGVKLQNKNKTKGKEIASLLMWTHIYENFTKLM